MNFRIRQFLFCTTASASVLALLAAPALSQDVFGISNLDPGPTITDSYGDPAEPQFSAALTDKAALGGMTADGSAFVGTVFRSYGNAITTGFIWTEGNGEQPLGDPLYARPLQANQYFTASDISADGSVIVGKAASGISGVSAGQQAYRWTADGGFRNLGALDDNLFSEAFGVSGDGSTVVGRSGFAGGTTAFRWTEATGMVSLGSLDGGAGTGNDAALAASWDGSVIAGYAFVRENNRNFSRAFRWDDAGGMTQLPSLDGGTTTVAYDVSWDGRVIVGSSTRAGSSVLQALRRAVRWVDGEVSLLSSLPAQYGEQYLSEALGVSGNGQVIVGTSAWNDSRNHGFRWTEVGGMLTIEDWLRASGAVVASNFPGRSEITATASATNADGSIVIGLTHDNKVYIARGTGTGPTALPGGGTSGGGNTGGGDTGGGDTGGGNTGGGDTGGGNTGGGNTGGGNTGGGDTGGGNTGGGNTGGGTGGGNAGGGGAGLITVEDLGNSLTGSGVANVGTTASVALIVNGAGSRPLDRRVDEGERRFSFGGDFGRDDHDSRNGALGLGEIAFGYNFGPVQVNGAFGQTGVDSDTLLGGRTDTRAQYIKLEAMGRLSGTDDRGLWAILTGTALKGQADIARNYLVGGGVLDTSRGEADVTAFGLRGRLQYENLFPHISPYGEVSHSRSCLGAYTETGGAFPAAFDKLCDDATELRLGFDTAIPLTEAVSLTGTLEGVHRLQSKGANVTGQIIGLGAFDLGAADLKQDWLRAGLGVTMDLNGSELSVVANGTTRGEAASTWVAVNWSMSF